jgi:hypothetical protein
MNWFSKNYMRLRFQNRIDALKKAGIPVTQETVYDETLDVGVPVPSAERGSGRRQGEYRASSLTFVFLLFTSSAAAFFRWLVTPRGPTVFEEANREYFRHGGVRQRLVRSLLLLAVGMVCAAWSGLYAYMGLSSSSWPTANGVICDSEIATQDGDRSPSGRRTETFIATVRYAYTIGNKQYTAERVCFGDYGSSGGGRARQVQVRYPAGATVLVHYHPGNPKIAVLETGATWFIFLWVSVGTLFTLCGIVGLIRTSNAQRIYKTAEPPSAGDVAARAAPEK